MPSTPAAKPRASRELLLTIIQPAADAVVKLLAPTRIDPQQVVLAHTAIGLVAAWLLAGSGRYVPESLEYRSGSLDFTLRGADVETLDQLRGQIVALGYAVELVSMVPGSGGVEGKLRIRGGGA